MNINVCRWHSPTSSLSASYRRLYVSLPLSTTFGVISPWQRTLWIIAPPLQLPLCPAPTTLSTPDTYVCESHMNITKTWINAKGACWLPISWAFFFPRIIRQVQQKLFALSYDLQILLKGMKTKLPSLSLLNFLVFFIFFTFFGDIFFLCFTLKTRVF